MSDCWPEQEAIEKWFDEYVRGKYKVFHSNQNLMELKEAVTKPRIEVQNKLEKIGREKDKLIKELIEASKPFISGDIVDETSGTILLMEALEEAINAAEAGE